MSTAKTLSGIFFERCHILASLLFNAFAPSDNEHSVKSGVSELHISVSMHALFDLISHLSEPGNGWGFKECAHGEFEMERVS